MGERKHTLSCFLSPTAALRPAVFFKPVLCSNIHTSVSTLKRSTLTALTEWADFQMSFQLEYAVVHEPEIAIATAATTPPP